MSETSTPEAAVLAASEHQMNLRQLQIEVLESLYMATHVAGFALLLLTFTFRPLRGLGTIGVLLMLGPLPARILLARRYLASAWMLAGIWLSASVAITAALPGTPAPCLLALPVGLATLLISPKAGFAAGIAASLVALRIAPGAAIEFQVMVLMVIWGVFSLAWLAIRPPVAALQWSWRHYDQARRELDLARDTQAELKQAMKDLSDASMQAERLNQLLGAARRVAEEAERAKAEFVANVSHELRTPLNMIIGFAEMIVEAPATYGAKLPPALLADVAAIQRNSQHLASLINDVLDISQVEARRMALSREWVSPAEIIEAALLAVKPLFDSRGLYLRADIPADLPLLYCDRTRIRQVLLNLLNNAARFTEKGGVMVEAGCDHEKATISVIDTGPGIAKVDLPKLFEPFRQLDGALRHKQGGSGLGLNISRRFVELHGGEMGVQSQVGVGSRFWFSLPLTPPGPDLDSAVRWLSSEWEPKRRSRLTPRRELVPRIVVLEPDDLLREAVARYLDGVEIAAAATPAEACALLATTPAQVLLVRGESPEQTSAWTAELRKAPIAAPIVACPLPNPRTVRNLGAVGYLAKPITRTQLFQAIEGLGIPVRSILLTDDDPEALQLFTRILSSGPKPYQVLQAAGGQEALHLLRSRRPDLLLLDLVMPTIDGFAVLAEKNRDPELKDIPVLILSAQDREGQAIVAPSLLATRAGGLSLPDLLRSALALSEILGITGPTPDPGHEATPGG